MKNRFRTVKFSSCCALVLACCFINVSHGQAQQKTGMADVNDKNQVQRGKRVYKRFCSYCHGINLKGERDWRTRKADGMLPAPPHDESGHTWHHPDDMLFSIIKYGMVPPNAPAGYVSNMPGWEDTLKDEDIWAVLSYIKSTWPKHILEQQQEINRQSLLNR